MDLIARLNLVSGEVLRFPPALDSGVDGELFVEIYLAEQGFEHIGSGLRFTLSFPLPSLDLDDDGIWNVEIGCFLGAPNRVHIQAPEGSPEELVETIVVEVLTILDEDDVNEDFNELPYKIDYLGIWILNGRIRRIEESVRIALDDVKTSDEDLLALRKYPERLAKVEELARALGRNEPDRKDFEEKTDYSLYATPTLDYFFKAIQEVESEAKQATSRMSGLISSQQVVLTKQQNEESARFQRVVTVVGAAVLVPGLVAAIFGANVNFNGRNSSEAFWGMILLMAGSAIASYGFLKSLEVEAWKSVRSKWPISKLPEISDLAQIGLLGLVAIAAIGAGIAVFFST